MTIQPALLRVLFRCLLASAILTSCLGGSQPARAAATLQQLIDSTPAGGVVNLPAGTYAESLLINKSLFLHGSPSPATIIQPPAGLAGMRLVEGADNVVVMDLTITGATGGGIDVAQDADSTLTLWRCTLTSNSALYGGGIYMRSGTLTVNDSLLQGNAVSQHGGGIYATGPLTLRNTTISGNTAVWHGGGVHANAGLVTITGGSFEGNTATGGNGGGLNLNDHLTISGTTFINNQAGGSGGGVLQWNEGKTLQLSDITFQNNRAKRNGGGMAGKGSMTVTGGAFINNYAGDPTSSADVFGGGLYEEGGALNLTGTTFTGNIADCKGCSFLVGGGLAIQNTVANRVTNAVFQSNKAWSGGGLFSGKRQTDPIYGSLTVQHSTFSGNQAGYGGGLQAVNLTVQDSLFQGNFATNSGGGFIAAGTSTLDRVRILGNTAQGHAAGVHINGSATVNNAAIVNNTGSPGASVVSSAVTVEAYTANVVMRQVTIASNTGGKMAGLLVNGGTLNLSNMIIANQAVGVCLNPVQPINFLMDGVLWDGNTQDTGSGVTGCSVEPTVDHPVYGSPAFAADGYHITAGSAAYNAGFDTPVDVDIDGDARPLFGRVDLGADELVYRVWLPVVRR